MITLTIMGILTTTDIRMTMGTVTITATRMITAVIHTTTDS